MNKNSLIIGAVIIMLALGGWFFVKSNSPAATPNPNSMTKDENPSASAMGDVDSTYQIDSTDSSAMAGIIELTVNGSNFKFEPKEIKVKKGDKIKLTFKNTGGFHDFVIDELNVKAKQAQSPASETVEFTADKAGSYEFYCSVGNHRNQGMKGTLVVE